MSTNIDDVISGCLADDPAACSDLFERVKGLIYRTAYLMSGNAQDAEDALQDVFLRILRSLHTYDPARGALTTWVHRITVNYCVAKYRAEHHDVPLPMDTDPKGYKLPSGGADPHTEVSMAEQAELLLGMLNEDQRAVAVLRFYWDLSYQEIAEILGVELGTVQSRLGRAIKRMRTVIATQEVQ